MILSKGSNPKDIIFSNPIKLETDIDYAYRKGVRITTADTIDELIKIQKVAPKMKILWRIAINEH
jgi:diaminopimelate decarboxylase